MVQNVTRYLMILILVQTFVGVVVGTLQTTPLNTETQILTDLEVATSNSIASGIIIEDGSDNSAGAQVPENFQTASSALSERATGITIWRMFYAGIRPWSLPEGGTEGQLQQSIYTILVFLRSLLMLTTLWMGYLVFFNKKN